MNIDKIKILCDKITQEQQERLKVRGLDCEANIFNAKAHFKLGKKYTKIDIGTSGRYMVDNVSGEIFGIKAYGVIHKGHYFGTLDSIDDFFWGDYRAYKIKK